MALENLSISRLSQRNQLLLLTLAMLALCYAFYNFYINPLAAEVEELNVRLQVLKNDVQKGQILYAQLPEFKRQVREQEARLAALRGVLPEGKETAAMVRGIEQLARESRLDVKSFQPQTSRNKEFYEDWPILLSLEGNYDNLGTFFEKVSQYTRIINVDNIAIKKLEKGGRNRTITATCTATTFVFIEGEREGEREENEPVQAERPLKERPSTPAQRTKPRMPS